MRTQPSIAVALIAELDNDALALLADRLGPLLPRNLRDTDASAPDRWMGTAQAAEYLGLTRNALHKLTGARSVPFEQERRGGKCWFLRSELDAWRRGISA